MTGANRHDVTQVENVLASRVRRPQGEMRQNLCADAGYDSEEARTVMRSHGYTPHVRSRGEEKRELAAGKRARRWIVEVAHSWFNRFRKILFRFERKKSLFNGCPFGCCDHCLQKIWCYLRINSYYNCRKSDSH